MTEINETLEILVAEAVAQYEPGMSVAAICRDLYKVDYKFSFDYFRCKAGEAIKKSAPTENKAVSPEKKVAKTVKKAPVKKQSEPKPFVLCAWNFDDGFMMSIDEYCAHYKLPYGDVISYKLVSHTGTPYYNILFKDVLKSYDIISEDFIEKTISKFIGVVDFAAAVSRDVAICDSGWFTRAVYADAHIGMNTDKDGIAMYATAWNRKEQLRRAKVLVDEIIRNRIGSVLYLDELGDFMDGYNGYTTRGGHQLPQNMSNEEAFDVGLEFKMYIIDNLVPYFDRLVIHNICNDNHAGSFGYVVNSAVQKICLVKYAESVTIDNQRQFINFYIVGKHAFITSHGKDSKSLKFGFKPKLDPVQIEKIDAYLKYNKIYNKAEFIEFSKGDSHQMLLDYCTSDDFDYFNFPAFAPASEWVQTNFKPSRSGFVIQNVRYDENVKHILPRFF